MIPSGSPLKTLNPFLDGSGVFRLGGYSYQSPMSYKEKNPVILSSHRVSEIIVLHAHVRSMHGGIQLALYTLHEGFGKSEAELW